MTDHSNKARAAVMSAEGLPQWSYQMNTTRVFHRGNA